MGKGFRFSSEVVGKSFRFSSEVVGTINMSDISDPRGKYCSESYKIS